MIKTETDTGAVEIFENSLEEYLHLFCEENNIDDMRKASQSVWNSCLRFIYKNVFKGKNLLKQRKNTTVNGNIISSNFNAYDYDAVLQVLDIYVYDMCMKYDKEVSILGFSTLTGIDGSIIHDWGRNGRELSDLSSHIYKKLRQFREESLSNKLATGNKNPVGILAILNRHYQWNMPGVHDRGQKEQVTRLEDLKGRVPKLCENDTQFDDN